MMEDTNIIKYIENYTSINDFYIFGAGKMAEMLAAFCRKNQIAPKAFVVSTTGNANKKYMKSIPIKNIDLVDNKEALIIVATLSHLHSEVRELLTSKGFNNILFLDELSYAHIRSTVVENFEQKNYASIKNRITEMMRAVDAQGKNILLVTDCVQKDMLLWAQKVTAIPSDSFINGSEDFCGYDYIFSVLTNWNYSVNDYVNKLLSLNTTIVLSFRSVFISYKEFDLYNYVSSKGYYIESMFNYYRPSEEYDVEDIILVVRKGNRKSNLDVRNEYGKHYDIGLVGCWSCKNYGDELTYYSLNRVLTKMGYSVLMIEWPNNSWWKPYGTNALSEYSLYRAEDIAELSNDILEMSKYNDICDMFVVGSGQLLSPLCHRMFQKSALLPWVFDRKKRMIISQSFGSVDISGFTESETDEIRFYLSRMDEISVREHSAVKIMSDTFGVNASFILDPVFLCNREDYDELLSCDEINGEYILAYVLDLNDETLNGINQLSRLLGVEVVIISDPRKAIFDSELSISTDVSLNKFLSLISKAKFVVTDSFHGTCFSIIYERQFVAIANYERGYTRFESILSDVNLMQRLAHDPGEIVDIAQKTTYIDYNEVNVKLDELKSNSLNALEKSLKRKVEHIVDYRNEDLVRSVLELKKQVRELQ